jgi:phytoene dehydrogenase-like protein
MDAQLQELKGHTADVIVVGGGLAGLASAATAAKADVGASVVLLDVQAGGGQAVTDQVGRYRFNRGAHALYRKGPAHAVCCGTSACG